MTYTAIDDVAASLRLRGVRVDSDIVRFEAGNVVAMRDLDGLPTYVHDFPPDMLEGSLRDAPHGRPASDAALVAGGHGIVYVSNMDRAIRFYTSVLGLT